MHERGHRTRVVHVAVSCWCCCWWCFGCDSVVVSVVVVSLRNPVRETPVLRIKRGFKNKNKKTSSWAGAYLKNKA